MLVTVFKINKSKPDAWLIGKVEDGAFVDTIVLEKVEMKQLLSLLKKRRFR